MNERYESFSERICDGTVNKGIDVSVNCQQRYGRFGERSCGGTVSKRMDVSVNKTAGKGMDVLVNEGEL